ncbi:MAG: hypothetical protein L0312_11370 [Acidobacteria bacterium]|nr:hypothetical protein [Acidobacteriota bacterium]
MKTAGEAPKNEPIEQAIFFPRKTRFAFAQQVLDFGDSLIVFSFRGDNHIKHVPSVRCGCQTDH